MNKFRVSILKKRHQRKFNQPSLVKTGDILQFGVDVDNNPRTTYWCVIAQVLCNQQNYEFTEADWEPLSRYVKVNKYKPHFSSRLMVFNLLV